VQCIRDVYDPFILSSHLARRQYWKESGDVKSRAAAPRGPIAWSGDTAGCSEAAKDSVSRESVTVLPIAYMVCMGEDTLTGGGRGRVEFEGKPFLADLAPGAAVDCKSAAQQHPCSFSPTIHQALVLLPLASTASSRPPMSSFRSVLVHVPIMLYEGIEPARPRVQDN
jgi:hypothetical protein